MHKRDQWEHVWVLDGLSGGRGREETHNTYTLENSGGGVIIGVHCLLQYPTELSIGDWGEWLGHWKSSGCNMDNLWYYPNHTNLSAIVTTQHQWLNHPKKISVPLGQQSNAAYALQTIFIDQQFRIRNEDANLQSHHSQIKWDDKKQKR